MFLHLCWTTSRENRVAVYKSFFILFFYINYCIYWVILQSTIHKAEPSLLFTYHIPRASGQSRAMPAHVRSGDTGLSNRKWSYWKYTEPRVVVFFYIQSANNGCDWSGETKIEQNGHRETEDRNEAYVRLVNSVIRSVFLIRDRL